MESPEEEKSAESGQHDEGIIEEESLSFFIMPADAISSLREELIITDGEEIANDILYRYGVKCGSGMSRKMAIECTDLECIGEMFPVLWTQVGLGRMNVQAIEDDRIIVAFEDSVEAREVGMTGKLSCHFTTGYLTGMVSGILGTRFEGKEIECIARGDPYCVHEIYRRDDVKPTETEAVVDTEAVFELESGVSYLFKSENPEEGFMVFVDGATHGMNGLCITRTFPQRVRKRYNLTKTPILWLTSEAGKDRISYPHLGKLYEIIGDFLKESERPIILLDGIEYLITQNEYKSTLKFLQLIVEKVAINEGVLILPLKSGTLDSKDMNLLEREMVVIEKLDELRREKEEPREEKRSNPLGKFIRKPEE